MYALILLLYQEFIQRFCLVQSKGCHGGGGVHFLCAPSICLDILGLQVVLKLRF